MKILLHQNSRIPLRVISNTQEEIRIESTTCTSALWELAMRYPDELIGWCEESLEGAIVSENWENIFHHDLIMASYAIRTTFLPDIIGYVDQLPFVHVNKLVKYPTWLMSSDIGGIKATVLLQFKNLLGKVEDLGYLLNSVAKIGQQNGLLCYSEPGLLNAPANTIPIAHASYNELFSFVYQHYTTLWTSVLLFCLNKFEKKYPIAAYSKAFFQDKIFRSAIDLSVFEPLSLEGGIKQCIDVIIPTLERREYLKMVLDDLNKQTFFPVNVIIVEQNPDEDSQSHLQDIIDHQWSFKIIHIFTHQTGACNARNLALEKVQSEWIFFADDDIRLGAELLERVMEQATRYQVSALNLNCKQPNEETIFHKVKQWGSFGAGTSFVKSSFALKCRFSEIFEYGYGEDADFGMQLRNIGCDIIYFPYLEILHLKAPTGGFRKKLDFPWKDEALPPKPSPTLMAYTLKHCTREQINGFKVSLFLKFYLQQPVKNPVIYLREMRKRWERSDHWAKILSEKATDTPPYTY